MSSALCDPTRPAFVLTCNYEELAPLAPPLIPPPFSDRPWQGMLGPAGHAVNKIGHSYSKKKTTLSVMGNVSGWGGGSSPARITWGGLKNNGDTQPYGRVPTLNLP